MTPITDTQQIRTLFPWAASGLNQLRTSYFPEEVYDKIFYIIASSATPLHSIIAFGSVSKGFKALCFIHFPLFRTMNALSRIYISMPVASEPVRSPLPNLDQYFLAADQSGNQYYCSQYYSPCFEDFLCIINPLHKRLITLPETDLEDGDHILDCHPIKEGCILVRRFEVTAWHFTNDSPEPVLAWRTHPFAQRHRRDRQILNSSLFNEKFLLRAKLTVHVLDLKDPLLPIKEVVQVDELVGEECKYLNFNNQTYAFVVNEGKMPSTVVQLQDIKPLDAERCTMIGRPETNCLIGRITTAFKSDPQLTPMGKYLIQPNGKDSYITIFDQNLKICCDADMKITYPAANGRPLFDINRVFSSGMIFIENDFLFVSYPQGNLRVIHLPSKKDWSKLFNAILPPYLKGRMLFSCSFIDDKGESFFRVSLQPSECPFGKKNNQSLEWIDIPLDFSAPIAEGRKDKPSPPISDKPDLEIDTRTPQAPSMPATPPSSPPAPIDIPLPILSSVPFPLKDGKIVITNTPFSPPTPIAESRKDQPPPALPTQSPRPKKHNPKTKSEIAPTQIPSVPTPSPSSPATPISATTPTRVPPPSNSRQNQTPKSCCSAQDRLSSWFKNIHPVGKFFFGLGVILTLGLVYLATLIGFACVSDENN